ncbi:hypothetical protein C2G38_2194725 [Gigaspora rosea]|uniref:Uncharacterized protein n=1 Tax=Gigaspora rosea TaxID=44941 RepID=A0A397V0P4_9GLOM|nr:hypothetical protein C2G38_2194725 [Gigaspora rosea]
MSEVLFKYKKIEHESWEEFSRVITSKLEALEVNKIKSKKNLDKAWYKLNIAIKSMAKKHIPTRKSQFTQPNAYTKKELTPHPQCPKVIFDNIKEDDRVITDTNEIKEAVKKHFDTRIILARVARRIQTYKEKPTFTLYIEILTKALYQIQRIEGANLELDPVKFEHMIKATIPQLKRFFNYLMNAIIPKERSVYNVNESKKSIVGLCYMLAGLRNKFVNQHKLEVGLYLMASGATWETINTMLTLGYSVCAKTVEKYRKQIKKNIQLKLKTILLKM